MMDTDTRWQTFITVYLTFIGRLLVGGTLIVSGVTKLTDHSEFVAIVNSYDLLPEVLGTKFAMVLPWAEFIFGVYLILGIQIRLSALVSVLMAICFVVANISAIARGEEHCGSCFGDIVTLPVAFSLSIDILIIITGVFLVIMGGRGSFLNFDDFFGNRQRRKADSLLQNNQQ
jgi:uncharacterized membrane protein YphA (DoxX/SURF4 family)